MGELSTFEPRRTLKRCSIQGRGDGPAKGRKYRSLLSQLLIPLVCIEFFQEPVDVFFLEIIGRGEAKFVGVGAPDTDFMSLPQPVFEVHARDGWDVDRNDGAAKSWVGRCPG